MIRLKITHFGPSPIIIGESPGNNADPDHPLSCRYPSSAGKRLQIMTGLDEEEYEDFFVKMNLFKTEREACPWSHREATNRAGLFRRSMYQQSVELVTSDDFSVDVFLLGRKVCAAFDLMHLDFFKKHEFWFMNFYAIPHPSGQNRWYNKNFDQARDFWTDYMFEKTTTSV